ncbi:LysR family transcriptional regulator [Psychromonas sp. L1A2]|uniref:LysR family transcriptional regulator n=1 Tax=Psychromonas sp. L1A2 TaxID=2686356 RepID=UPI00135933F9|nr:LysR family transcriptional regulator [Psychromonas sp. L1A2]
MNLEQVETFLVITQTKNLSIAAKNLFISQSAVSHRIRNLEEKLGCKLLIRARGEKLVSLTLKGEEFIEIATRWKNLWNETKLWTLQESKMNLKVASIDSLNTCVFSRLYKDLINSNNAISLNVSSHWSKTIYDLIESHDIDIGLTLNSLKYPNAIAKPLFKSRGVVISSKSSKYPEIVHPNDLKTSNEILFSYIPEYEIWHNFWWEYDQNEYSSVDTVSLLFTMFDLEEKWAIVPIWIARVFEKIHPVKISELSVSPPEYSCYQVSNRNLIPSKLKAIKKFSVALEDYMKTDVFLNSIK